MPPSSPIRVLIVEDNPTDLLLAREALLSSGRFVIISKSRLGDALEALSAEAFDLVLLDLGLPDSQGVETLQRLRKAHPSVAVVVLTGKDDEQLALQALKEGAQDYLSKGLADFGLLPRAVRYAVERGNAEAALRQSEERFRLLVEGVKDYAILMLDPAGNVVTWNSGTEHLLGYSAEEIIGQPYSQIFLAEDVAAGVPQAILEEAARAERVHVEGWRVHKDGSRYWSNGSVGALRSPSGALRGFAIVTRDLTERKRAEEALVASERRLQELADAMPQFVWTTRIDGTIDYFNDRWYEFTGFPRGGTGDESWRSILHPEDVDRAMAAGRDALATGQDMQVELRLLDRRKGGYRWFLLRSAPVRDARGAITSWIGTSTDIDDLKRVESELRMRDHAIQAISQGVLITDPHLPDNPVVYASPGFERMTGYAASEAVGRNCRFLQGKDTDPAAVARMRDAVRDGIPCVVELVNYRKDGSPFTQEVSISPVRDESGQVIQFVGILTDVTERRSLEEQLQQAQKMEAVGQLAGGVAHDFNNLLTVISGYSEILLGKLPAGDPMRGAVKSIGEAGQRAASLTRQLLAFSRKSVLEPKILDLNEVVQETEKMLRRLIGEDILLTTVLDPAVARVKTDPGQMGQVLLNLAVNARDAMPQGGKLAIETDNVDLDARIAQADPGAKAGPHVRLTVSDNGTGMPPEVLARIFEPFFTTKGVGKGTGLGLAVVHGIVKQSGGHLEVSSRPGAGTTFRIYLPAVEEQASSPSKAGFGNGGHGTETVLLVEDEAGVRGFALLALQMRGYKVVEAEDGKSALKAAETHQGRIDIVVTDVVMPNMGGRAVAEAMRARYPGIKVLFTSGYTDDAVVRQGLQQEEIDFLQKPYTPSVLIRKVRQVLDRT